MEDCHKEAMLKIDASAKHEFLGWCEGNESTWFLDRPLEKSKIPSNINMILLRRK